MSLPDEPRAADPRREEPREPGSGMTGDLDSGPETEPGAGGYGPDRDPKTDMPRVPAAPETQDDSMSHDAAPDGDEPVDPYG